MLRCVIYCDLADQLGGLWRELQATADLELEDVSISTTKMQDVLDYARIPHAEHTVYFLYLDVDESEVRKKIQLCQNISRLDPHAYVVYVSERAQFALLCYQSHAFDFIVMPCTLSQLMTTVEAIVQDVERRARTMPLIIRIGGRILRVNQDHILYMSRERDYANAVTLREDLRWRESFASLLSRLDPRTFIRTHSGYIINLHYVVEVDTNTNLIRMANGAEIPYSRRNEQELMRALQRMSIDNRKETHEVETEVN